MRLQAYGRLELVHARDDLDSHISAVASVQPNCVQVSAVVYLVVVVNERAARRERMMTIVWVVAQRVC